MIRRPGPGLRPAASHRTRITRRRCCPTARCSSRWTWTHGTALASAELYDPVTGTWTVTGSTRTGAPYGDVAAQRQGARRWWRRFNESRKRGTLRSGDRDLDGDRQHGYRATRSIPRRCCPTVKCSSQPVRARASRARNSTTGERLLDGHRAASPTRAMCTPRRFLPNGKVLVAGGEDNFLDVLSTARNPTIRRPGYGLRRAASSPREPSHRDVAAQWRDARRWRFRIRSAISRARNSTIRRAGLGPSPAASPPHDPTHRDVAAHRHGARRWWS